MYKIWISWPVRWHISSTIIVPISGKSANWDSSLKYIQYSTYLCSLFSRAITNVHIRAKRTNREYEKSISNSLMVTEITVYESLVRVDCRFDGRTDNRTQKFKYSRGSQCCFANENDRMQILLSEVADLSSKKFSLFIWASKK